MTGFTDRNGRPVDKPADKQVTPRLSVYGLLMKDRSILFVRPTWSDKYELPGGGVGRGEEELQGLRREYREETGYLIRPISPVPIYQRRDMFYAEDIDEYFDSEQHFYEVRAEGGIIGTYRPKEISAVAWLPISSLREDVVKKPHLEVIMRYLGGQR